LWRIYSVSLWLATSAALPLGFFQKKIKHYVTNRLGKHLIQSGIAFVNDPIWFHALSVGEVLSVVSLVKKWHAYYPKFPLFFTASTLTGHEIAVKQLKNTVEGIDYFPLDLPPVIERYLKRIRPRLVILTETDLWPNFLRILKERQIPCLLINARMSERSYRRYCLIKPWFSKIIRSLSFIGVQREEDALRFLSFGFPKNRLRVMGSLKFDIDLPPIDEQRINRQKKILGIDQTRPIWMAGSTHRGEDEITLRVHKALLRVFSSLCLIIAPRHPERFDEVTALSQRMGFVTSRRTRPTEAEPQVIILDTLGELADFYAVADFVFLGGSFVPVGGHNPLEAARWAKPVIFGPYMFNFSTIAQQMLEARAALQVKNERGLFQWARLLLENKDLAQFVGKQGRNLIACNQGVGERYLEIIKRTLSL